MTNETDELTTELAGALSDVLNTGLNGGNNYRLAMLAASQNALSQETLDAAEQSEAATVRARAAIERFRQHNTAHCDWSFDHSECYWNNCTPIPFMFTDEGPAENNFQFCPHCGRPLRVVGAEDEEQP